MLTIGKKIVMQSSNRQWGGGMGKALEWLGAEGCATAAEELLTVTQHRSGEIWAACPFHQEGTLSLIHI